MYAKYQTEAIVLNARSTNEADKLLSLYTRDFGLVRAKASAIRTEASRMRYALQNFSLSRVALVRGTRGWRVTGALPEALLRGAEKHGVAAFARIAQLTLRLIGGEEKNEYLFNVLRETHTALSEINDAWSTIELVCVARVLYALGYLSPEALESTLFTHTAYTGDSLEKAEMLRAGLLSKVNHAISETHL